VGWIGVLKNNTVKFIFEKRKNFRKKIERESGLVENEKRERFFFGGG
jgi:hypothetical protein